MKNILKKSKGITLIALITTIIVILILASVATYSGIGIIEQAKLTSFTTELKIMQAEVNELYQKYKDNKSIKVGNDTCVGADILTIRKDSADANLSTNIENSSLPIYTVANRVFTSEESGIINKTGYLYFNKKLIEDLGIEGVEGEFFVNIEKRSVISCEGLQYQDETYYTLEQLPDSVYNVEYDNTENNETPIIGNARIEKVSDEKWRITVSEIQYNGYIDKWKVKYKLENEGDWNISDDLSFIVNKNGNYKLKIINGNIESAEKDLEKYYVEGDAYSINKTAESISNYYGEEITNYINIDDNESTNDWKVFYSDDVNIYLISSNYIRYNWAPTKIINNELTGVTVDSNYVENDNNSGYKLNFKTIVETQNANNEIKYYSNGAEDTDDIKSKMQKWNTKFYEYLEENQSATRNNANIRAIAYMYDTSIWNTKYLDNKEIGEYAIGSPSIEMLLNSYNKVNNTNYGAKVISNDGYKISTNKDSTDENDWKYEIENIISTDDKNLYIVDDSTKSEEYWISSPSANGANNLMSINSSGKIENNIYSYGNCSLRPIVCINAKYHLEPDGDNFKIVKNK